MPRKLQIKRIYEPPAKDDGQRVLIDRIWPRGIRKEAAALDLWLKEIAPSTPLRKWYGHCEDRWPEFQKRYEAELAGHADAVRTLHDLLRKGPVTLLYAAHDGAHSNAEVLRRYLSRP